MSKPSTTPPRIRLGYGGGNLTGESARNIRTTILRLSLYAKPYAWKLGLVTVLVIINTLALLEGPILLGKAIDEFIVNSDLIGLVQNSLKMVIVYLFGGVAEIILGIIMVDIAQRLVADIRTELFVHLQNLSMAYHDRHKVGDLMSRVTNDTDAINRVLSNGLIQFTSNILLLGGIMLSMFLLSWQLAIATLTLLPLMLLITAQVTQRSRGAFRQVQRNLGAMNAVMEENIAGIRVVKAFARENDTLEKFKVANARSKDAGIKADIITAALAPMFTTMSTITIAVTALLGGWLAVKEIITVGIIATFIIYIMNFFRPMRGIAMVYNHLQSAIAGAERIFDVLDTQSTVTDKKDALPLSNIQGQVTFDRVSFSYVAGKSVLNDISYQAKPGQTIALVGPTGAGKTTIINLLSRFYDIDDGFIRIDNHDLRDVQQTSIRSQLGIVLQDTFLFSGTVFENIRYGRLDATDEDIYNAARLANADWFIRRLPQGYQTFVSEGGHNFSQGQRQLIAIARAILANPRILILDEATSSVDTRTEIHIQKALLNLMEGRTAFVIAHRLSTIRSADMVIVIDGGKIIEVGNHESLLKKKGFYYNLYMSQYQFLQGSRTITDEYAAHVPQ